MALTSIFGTQSKFTTSLLFDVFDSPPSRGQMIFDVVFGLGYADVGVFVDFERGNSHL